MICPICKAEIKEDSKFCIKCGNQIPRCPTCNKVITKKVKFCIYDGTPLPEEILSAPLDTKEVNSVELKQSTNNIPEKKNSKVLPLLCIVLFLGVAGVLGFSIYKGNIPSDLSSQESMESLNTQNEYEEDDNNITETIATEQDFLATEEIEEAPPVSMDAISGVSATSYLTQSEYGLVHGPSNVVDGSLANAWVEDVPGQGIDESITIQLDKTYKVSGFYINAGYQKSANTYERNSRPATMVITFSDGSCMDVTLDDVNGQQQVTFPDAIETSSITLTIVSVYPGSKYEDTVISEIQLF